MNGIDVYTNWGGGLWLKCRTLTNFPHLEQKECRRRVTPVIGCAAACLILSLFLWLCAWPCFGCASTAAKDPTRCVLSGTPAPLPGPGSASNPEAMFAAICGQTHNQIRLITAHHLIRFNKTQTDFDTWDDSPVICRQVLDVSVPRAGERAAHVRIVGHF